MASTTNLALAVPVGDSTALFTLLYTKVTDVGSNKVYRAPFTSSMVDEITLHQDDCVFQGYPDVNFDREVDGDIEATIEKIPVFTHNYYSYFGWKISQVGVGIDVHLNITGEMLNKLAQITERLRREGRLLNLRMPLRAMSYQD